MGYKVFPLSGELQTVFDDSGRPLAGGRIFIYQASTTSPAIAYQDPDGTEHDNPIILDDFGRLPGTGMLYLDDTVSYKLIIRTRRGTMVGSYDDIVVALLAGTGGYTPPESTASSGRITFAPGTSVFVAPLALDPQPAGVERTLWIRGTDPTPRVYTADPVGTTNYSCELEVSVYPEISTDGDKLVFDLFGANFPPSSWNPQTDSYTWRMRNVSAGDLSHSLLGGTFNTFQVRLTALSPLAGGVYVTLVARALLKD